MNRKSLYLFVILGLVCINSRAQLSTDSITDAYVGKTISYLASNKLKGRVNFSPEQLEAAEFLAAEMGRFGLDPFPGYDNFFIPFRTRTIVDKEDKLEWNGRRVQDSFFFYAPSRLKTEPADLEEFFILKADYPLATNLLSNNWRTRDMKMLIWINLPDSISFSEAMRYVGVPEGMPASDILMVAAKDEPLKLKFTPNKNKSGSILYNVVGMLPGDSLPAEAVLFSAHYDHVDFGLNGETGEIFNGANDDASGTTAVLALADYFAKRHDNRRTLIFCLFAGEELGLYGSASFVNQLVPEKIKAVLNIEMIGMHNATGKNAFMVTGPQYSNLDDILEKNLAGESIRVQKLNADPARLFQRSDNFSFARVGIPAQTIMCSDDNEPCYHKPCDDVKRIDIQNMTRIIRAIATGARSLIDGTDTPTRIKF